MILEEDNPDDKYNYVMNTNTMSSYDIFNSKQFENLLNIPDYAEQFEIVHNLDFNNCNYGFLSNPHENQSLLHQLNTDQSTELINLFQNDSFMQNELIGNPQSTLLSPYQQHMLRFSHSDTTGFYSNNFPNIPDYSHYSNVKLETNLENNIDDIPQYLQYTPAIDKTVKLKTKKTISIVEKCFSCPNCPSRFTRKDELRRHEKIHIGIKTLTCPFCDKTFIRSDHRRTHIRTHTGEKPYSCDICCKSFARSDERTRHIRIHSKDTTRKRRKTKLETGLNDAIVNMNNVRFNPSVINHYSDKSSSPSTVISID